MREGSIVDASIIAAPNSTKNKEKKRDPEMHRTRKGNQGHFGINLYIGVDDMTGVVHSLDTTPANTNDLDAADKLLHDQEQRVFGDAGYRGIEKRKRRSDRDVTWYIADVRANERKWTRTATRRKPKRSSVRFEQRSSTRFDIPIKRMSGYDKVRYRGQSKNQDRFDVLAGFTNLLLVDKFVPI